MIITTHTRDIIDIEPALLFAIFAMAAWGGIVKRTIIPRKKNQRATIRDYLLQLVASVFSGFLLSIVVLARDATDDRVLIMAGLGGLFSGPILTIASKKITTFVETYTATTKKT